MKKFAALLLALCLLCSAAGSALAVDESVQGTLVKLSDAKTEEKGFISGAKVVIRSVTNFFQRIGRFLGL